MSKDRKSDHSWVIPAAVSTIPAAAYGISRHGELDIRSRYATTDKEKLMNKALQRRNIKTTLGVAGATVAASGVAELARRHFAEKQKDQQTKDIEQAVKGVVKSAFHQVQVTDPNHHDWKPAITGGVLDIPAGIAIGMAGHHLADKAKFGKLLQRIPIKALHTSEAATHLGTGIVSGVTTAGVLDYMQRKEEKKLRNAYLNKVAKQLGKHNYKPDSTFPKKELEMGRKVEKEHTDDYQTAENIAKDHLSESSKYYSALKKMEKGLDKKADEYADIAKIRSHMRPEKSDIPGAIGSSIAGAAEGGGLAYLAGKGLDVATHGKTTAANRYLTALGAIAGASKAVKSHDAAMKREKKEGVDLEAAVLRQATRQAKREQ